MERFAHSDMRTPGDNMERAGTDKALGGDGDDRGAQLHDDRGTAAQEAAEIAIGHEEAAVAVGYHH